MPTKMKHTQLTIVVTLALMSTLIEKSECLKTIDLCIKHKMECKPTENKMICQESLCDNNFRYECGSDHCTITQEACEDYRRLNLFLNLFKRDLSYLYDDHIQKFKEFLTHIHHCPKLTFEWKAENVCSKATTCFHKKRMPFRAGYIYLIKQRPCQCPKEYSFDCSKSHCSKDKIGCDLMQLSQRANVNFGYKTNYCNH